MAKRNRVRYRSKGNPYPLITMTGKVFLRQMEAQEPVAAVKGDMRIYLSTESIPGNPHAGNYDATGMEGYLKAEIHDGKGWKPLSLTEFFPEREHYFGKRERPSDTWEVCRPALEKTGGIQLMRTYREHYVKTEEE